METFASGELTADSILGGRVRLLQEKRGYRFSLDAVLLAFFVHPRDGEDLCDLGTGCGVIPLILAHRFPAVRVFGVEIQERLASLAQSNVEANHASGRVRIAALDLKTLPAPPVPRKVQMVVSNPPFRPLGSGRINPESAKAMARHEIGATLADVASAADRLLDPGGRCAMVFPAPRAADLVAVLREHGLEPKRLRFVHSTAEEPATLVLAEAVKGAGPECAVLPPLFVYGPDGGYTPEMRGMLLPP